MVGQKHPCFAAGNTRHSEDAVALPTRSSVRVQLHLGLGLDKIATNKESHPAVPSETV